LVEQ